MVAHKPGFIQKLLSVPTPEILRQYISCNKSVFLTSFPGDYDAADLSLELEKLGMQSGFLVLDSLDGV